ncbi:MAG TPA: hypothetical protein PL137_03550 [Nocardioides sp.]|nr:hypothetical protein [Nocardioides sp.]
MIASLSRAAIQGHPVPGRSLNLWVLSDGLNFSLITRPPDTYLTLRGELDIATSPLVAQRVRNAIAEGCRSMKIDLTERHGTMSFVAYRPTFFRLCRATGLDEHFGLAGPRGGRRPRLTPAIAGPAAGARRASIAPSRRSRKSFSDPPKDQRRSRTWTVQDRAPIPGPLPPFDAHPAERSMTSLATPVPTEIDHHWELRLEEFEDGHSIRRFDCVDCGAVRFE